MRGLLPAALVALALLLPPPAWGRAEAAGGIVSVGGAGTEIVYALEQQDRLLAVDTTSLYPAETAVLPNVGYMRQLSAEPILALGPALVLAIEDAGPVTALDQLRDAGVPVVMVPETHTPEGVLAKIDTVAAAPGEVGRAHV